MTTHGCPIALPFEGAKEPPFLGMLSPPLLAFLFLHVSHNL